MNQFNYINKKDKLKDFSKGHKIAAALYLVTNHLSDNDPLKVALRTQAVTICTTIHEDVLASSSDAINGLLEAAALAHLISEKNISIISLELRHYVAAMNADSETLTALFTPVLDSMSVSKNTSSLSYNPRPLKVSNPSNILITNESKSKRQDIILSFINDRKSAGIKDIAALFSDTSEKTIQRELGTLVSAGKITKRGEKRWSVYMSV